MKTRIISNPLAINKSMREVFAWVPEQSDIDGLRVGGQAPNCWGQMAEVTDIHAVGVDCNGKAFACYYTRNGSGWISASMKVGELIRTVALTYVLNSAECDALEREMNAEVAA